ncbi:MAG: hypothetical protein Q7R71_02285 [bacterium]|nr:hypothetical protein [bacterium]
MLNTFPDLLTYGFFAPMLLRIAVAIIFGAVAYLQWKHRETIAHTTLPIVGQNNWWVWVSIIAHGAIALALLLGYYTQIAALLAGLGALKHFIFQHRFPVVCPFSRGTYFLVIMISLSLLLSGAGALAMDLPL